MIELPAGKPGNLDPRSAMVDLADQMRQAYQRDPGNANLAREYRLTLQALSPRKDDGVVAELDAFIRDLSKPVYTDDDYGA